MTLSLDSWENVADQVAKLFDRNLLPYYNDQQHIPMILQTVGELMGVSSFDYVKTNVPLPEPLCSVKRRLYISIPLVALYVNQRVNLPELKVKMAKNFDVFDDVKTMDSASQSSSANDSMGCHRIKNPKRNKKFPRGDGVRNSKQPFLLEDPFYSVNGVGDGSDNFSDSDLTVLIQIFRVVIMVHHWWKHRLLDTTFLDHASFEEIEMARRNVRYTNRKTIGSIRGNCLKTIGNYCYDDVDDDVNDYYVDRVNTAAAAGDEQEEEYCENDDDRSDQDDDDDDDIFSR